MKKVLLILTAILLSHQISHAQFINPPSELHAEPEDPFYMKINWSDNSNNESGFYIERATRLDSADWEVLGGVGQNVRSFHDYWLTLNKKYYYRAYAYNSEGRSDYSNTDSIIATGDTTNYPAAPSELRITDITMTSITISWNDNSVNESGFIIARRKPGDMLFEYIDTVGTDVLSYQELGLNPDNVYFYKVCSYNPYGTSDFSNTVSGTTKSSTIIVNGNNQVAAGFFLSNNYPNPFNPVTNIRFGIPVSSNVILKIYNSEGKTVETLINSRLAQGEYTINWNASGFSSGAYFYRIEAGYFSEVKKMILVK